MYHIAKVYAQVYAQESSNQEGHMICPLCHWEIEPKKIIQDGSMYKCPYCDRFFFPETSSPVNTTVISAPIFLNEVHGRKERRYFLTKDGKPASTKDVAAPPLGYNILE